jgi:hypothetical protein
MAKPMSRCTVAAIGESMLSPRTAWALLQDGRAQLIDLSGRARSTCHESRGRARSAGTAGAISRPISKWSQRCCIRTSAPKLRVTVRCSPTACESLLRGSLGRGSPWAHFRSTTSPTTSPSSSATTAGWCVCTARERPAPSRPAPPRSRPRSARSASRCSSRAAWGPAASCSPAARGRWSEPSAPRATAPGAG